MFGILETLGDNAKSGPLPSRNRLVDFPLLGKLSNWHRLRDHYFPQLANTLPERAHWRLLIASRCGLKV